MSIDRGYGIATSAVIADSFDLDALIADTEAAKVAAQAAQVAAETAETNAETAETNAAASASAAATSESNIAGSEAVCAASETAAEASATAAAASETAAAASETAAAASETAAATSETNAATSETNAASSASSASSSATSASASATTATTQATNASSSATSAASSATSASSSATAAASSASAASTSETNAASSASSASTSASNASTSETNAATSASNAATSETNAATSETNAASSATAAASSASAAETYADNFDDAYLGAKASDPTLDNDGDALADGALYFDTTNDVMKVYDLASTTWYQLTPTVQNQTNINTVAGISSDVTTVAGDSADIQAVAADSADIGTVATNISNVNAVGTDIANVNTVANNLTDVNAFGETYKISATAPTSPSEGDLWFDTTSDTMKVYNGSSWQNAGSSVNGVENSVEYTATSGQTTFSATYDPGYVQVYLNGVRLDEADYTATNGTSVVLDTGAALNDVVYIQSFGTFVLADHYNKTDSDARYLQTETDPVVGAVSGIVKANGAGTISAAVAGTDYLTPTGDGSQLTGINTDLISDTTPQLGGDLDTNGNNVNFGDDDKAQFGASNDLQIYHNAAGDSTISESGAGSLKILADDLYIRNAADTQRMIRCIDNGLVGLYYAGSEKLATTSSGIDVTGNVDISNGQLDLDPNYRVRWGASNNYSIMSDNANYIQFNTDGSERMRIDSSGNLKFNSGYGSAATAYGVRAWVQFNGSGTVSINQSGNVSSITDQGTGYYQVNFSSALPDAQYAVSMAGRRVNSNGDVATAIRGTTDGGTVYNSSAFNWTAKTATGHSPIDLDIACVQVVR